MTLTRRRFLMIAASAAALPTVTQAKGATWRGRALGAEAQVTLHDLPQSALSGIPQMLQEIEGLFSLYDPNSTLSTLNRDGALRDMPDQFAQMLDLCNHLHMKTDGLFDPTVQTLWRAHATGEAPAGTVGWDQINRDGTGIRLGKAQHLTFNGIAQGFATDLVAAHLKAQGARDVLVNIGEFHALGGTWTLGIEDPAAGLIGHRTLTAGALATSSPAAMQVGTHSHIFHPQGGATRWSSVTVEATSAALADGASTAISLTRDIAHARKITHRLPDIRKVTLVDQAGDVVTI